LATLRKWLLHSVDYLTPPVFIIVNPAAGRGSALPRLNALRAAFTERQLGGIYETTQSGDEERVTALALARGARTIVAVGGDGTCSRIANAVLRTANTCRLAVLPAGTGNDFAKTLGVTAYGPEQIKELVSSDRTAEVDVGFADGQFFLNSCGFGFDASVLEATSRVRFLKGDAVYIYSALQQLFTYRGIDVSPSGAQGAKRGRMLMVTVSNGRFLGGAFKIAPHASVLDGKLDACFFSDAGVVERVKLFLGALRGTHLGMPSVSSAGVRELTLTFADKPKMEMDGELRTARSRTVELKCIPGALSVLATPGAPA